ARQTPRPTGPTGLRRSSESDRGAQVGALAPEEGQARLLSSLETVLHPPRPTLVLDPPCRKCRLSRIDGRSPLPRLPRRRAPGAISLLETHLCGSVLSPGSVVPPRRRGSVRSGLRAHRSRRGR